MLSCRGSVAWFRRWLRCRGGGGERKEVEEGGEEDVSKMESRGGWRGLSEREREDEVAGRMRKRQEREMSEKEKRGGVG